MSDAARYGEMFEYLREPDMPSEAEGTLVFGRRDPLLAAKMAELSDRDLASWFVVSGGLGKDSGELWETGTPEALYIWKHVTGRTFGLIPQAVHLETQAMTGTENARFGLRTMVENGLPGSYPNPLTALAHATSLKRLAATLEKERTDDAQVSRIHRVPTDYPFDPYDVRDRTEAAQELLRLADWPEDGHIAPQSDLPEDLVDFARGVTETPKNPPALAGPVLRKLPLALRRAVVLRQADR